MTNGHDPKADAIGAAIAKTDQPVQVAMMNIEVKIASTGRQGALLLPADASDGEVAEIAGLLLTQVLGMARQNRARTAGGRIIVPGRA